MLTLPAAIYFDRAYVGKLQFIAQLPKVLSGAELVNTVNYLDGLVFGRRLLVTGFPQGPLLVGTTVRGSPEGGNRAEYVLEPSREPCAAPCRMASCG
jgi:hypothetical protein